MVMRTGSRRVISAMCAEFLPHVRPFKRHTGRRLRPDREVTLACRQDVVTGRVEAEARLGRMLLDDHVVAGLAAPNRWPLPGAIGKPTKLMSGSIEPLKIGWMSAGGVSWPASPPASDR